MRATRGYAATLGACPMLLTACNSGGGGDVHANTRAGMTSPAVAGVPTRVYVPNRMSNTLDVIDPATFRIIGHFPVGNTPQHGVPSWELKTLCVDNNKGNSLTPIDPMTDPYNLCFTPDGTRAIVMAERNSRVEFRDPKTWKLVQSVPIPHVGVNHADFSPNGKVMLASCEFSGWVVRIDLETMSGTGQLQVGGMPVDVKSSADGGRFWVTSPNGGVVQVVDTHTGRHSLGHTRNFR